MLLKIANFKCHQKFEQTLPGLTVLCGKNGTGKSSIIQALLLYHLAENLLKSGITKRFKTPLNGPFSLALGTGDDILSHFKGQPSKIDIAVNNHQISFSPDEDEESEYIWATLENNSFSTPQNQQGPDRNIPNFVYLSAERIGPRLIQPTKQGYKLSTTGIGVHGENVAEFLKLVQRSVVDSAIGKYADTDSQWVRNHLEFWMSKLFGKIEIRVTDNGQFAPPSIQFLSGGVSNEWVHATHQGFGVTYALPVLLVGLASQEGDTLIIDSPEAHLHPAAQTELAKFLGIIAEGGRKVLLETHSDHVIDGVRLAVASEEIPELTQDKTKILYFSLDSEGHALVDKIDVLEDGSLSQWPSGFFDQMSFNLRALSECKRRARKQ